MPLKSKTPAPNLAGIESLDEVARRYFSDKKRQSMPTKRFAGPGRTYPIENQDDLDNAARLIGHADDPEAVKRKAISIAKELGLSLPDSWQAEEASKAVAKRADQPEDGNDDGEDAMQLYDRLASVDSPDDNDGNEDDTEEGDEDLKPEAVGGRAEDKADILRNVNADILYYAPIARIDRKKREVIGVATAEIKDAYRTVIGYEASKDAFARWAGNIREMHQSKAVGRALEIRPDDDHRRIIVRAKISKGAEDTWQKVLDGTLRGFSIGGKNGQWTTRTIDGEELPYLERYDQAELSLVDNPACPAATIEVVRADGLPGDVLAKDEEMTTQKPKKDVERKSVQISAANRDKLHASRDALTSMCADAGCEDCMATMNKAAENDDKDGDMDPPSRSAIADIVRSIVAESLRTELAPVLSRVNALLTYDAQRSDDEPEITRRVDDLSTDIAAIKKLVEEIHAQPADGGPVLHGGGPVDKVLATSAARSHGGSDAEAIQRAMALGFSPPDDPQEQIRAASKLFRPIPR